MYDIAIQTEETAKKFLLGNPELGGTTKRYHRFNVQNLPEHGWDSYSDSGIIGEIAFDYVEHYVEEFGSCAEQLLREHTVLVKSKS